MSRHILSVNRVVVVTRPTKRSSDTGISLYMDAALAHLRSTGAEVKPEDVVRLSPLGHEHINVLGRYSFALADRIAQGELRPLYDPADSDDLRIGAA